jgi:hypothetical protein
VSNPIRVRPTLPGLGGGLPGLEGGPGDLDDFAQPLHLGGVLVVGDALEAVHQPVSPAKYWAARRKISWSVTKIVVSVSNSCTRARSRVSSCSGVSPTGPSAGGANFSGLEVNVTSAAVFFVGPQDVEPATQSAPLDAPCHRRCYAPSPPEWTRTSQRPADETHRSSACGPCLRIISLSPDHMRDSASHRSRRKGPTTGAEDPSFRHNRRVIERRSELERRAKQLLQDVQGLYSRWRKSQQANDSSLDDELRSLRLLAREAARAVNALRLSEPKQEARPTNDSDLLRRLGLKPSAEESASRLLSEAEARYRHAARQVAVRLDRPAESSSSVASHVHSGDVFVAQLITEEESRRIVASSAGPRAVVARGWIAAATLVALTLWMVVVSSLIRAAYRSLPLTVPWLASAGLLLTVLMVATLVGHVILLRKPFPRPSPLNRRQLLQLRRLREGHAPLFGISEAAHAAIERARQQ